MTAPAIPEDESSRLETLHALNILDTAPEERFDRLTRLAIRLFNVPIAQVSLIDENRQWFKSCLGIEPIEVPRELTFCGHTILGDGPFIVPDTTKDERFADNPFVVDDPRVRFYAGHPLDVRGSKVGTICLLDTVVRDFNEDDQSVLKDLADMAQQELVALHMATMDELTDLTNRRGFMVLARNALKYCVREDIPATLVFFDLNDFKAINDQFGHAAGDNVLVLFARQLKETLRDSDIVARIGGDEFAALLLDAEDETTQVVLKRLKAAVAVINATDLSDYALRYSAGVLPFKPSEKDTIEGLLAEADALMYEQKRS